MKKSKVIIPAMALLLFSTAASITGTVAWFTSTRVFESHVASFGINAVEDSLAATVAPRVGTKLDSNDATKIVAGATNTGANSQAVNNRLYHGSFNAFDTQAWILNPTNDGSTNIFSPCGVEKTVYGVYHGAGQTSADADNDWLVRKNAVTTENNASQTYNYYVAFSWSVTFNYTFGSEGANSVAILLDTKDSTIAVETGGPIRDSLENGSGKNTSNGFRIAFYPVGDNDVVSNGNSEARIFAKNNTRTYITAANNPLNTPGGSYTDGVFNMQDANATRAADMQTATTYNALPSKICSIDKPSNSAVGSKKIICVAWFEGTDNNVVTEAVMESVKADLTFYSRSIGTGA